MNVCHVYPYEVADGPKNMALDEALLDAVCSGQPKILLRSYGWSVPTLSLGYFQSAALSFGPIRAGARSRSCGG